MQALIEVKNLQRNSTFITYDNVVSKWLRIMDNAPDAYTGVAYGPAYVFNLKKDNGEIIETRYSDTHFLI